MDGVNLSSEEAPSRVPLLRFLLGNRLASGLALGECRQHLTDVPPIGNQMFQFGCQ